MMEAFWNSLFSKVMTPESCYKVSLCSRFILLFSIVSWTVSDRYKRAVDIWAVVLCGCKRLRCGICHANSDFWWEKSCDGISRKFTSAWNMNPSTLAKPASVTGFLLRSSQHREYNGAVALGGWTWQENHTSLVLMNLELWTDRNS